MPGEVKIERSDRLEETAEEVARRFRTANTGIEHTILAEEIQDGYMTGYTGNYIKTYIEDPEGSLEPGAFYRVRLTELYKDGCKGEII